MGGKGALNYLPIVPKASIYVPNVMRNPVMGSNTVSETLAHMFLFRSAQSNVMRNPVMGGNTVSETLVHMFLFRSAQSSKNWPRQSIWSVMAEYERKGTLNYLPIVPKASIYVQKVMRKQLWAVTPCLKLLYTCFSSEVRKVSKTYPDSQFGA